MGLFLEKSRARHWSIYNQLGYRIMDYSINFPIMQSGDYSWTLEDVDAFVYDTEDWSELILSWGARYHAPFLYQKNRADIGTFQYLPGEGYDTLFSIVSKGMGLDTNSL